MKEQRNVLVENDFSWLTIKNILYNIILVGPSLTLITTLSNYMHQHKFTLNN